MKKTYILLLLLTSKFVFAQQDIVAIENITYPIPEGVTSILDVNNLLNPFVGNWTYTNNSVKISVSLEKKNIISDYKNRSFDVLVLKYEIRDVNNNLISTHSIPGGIEGYNYSLEKSTFKFSYFPTENFDCGIKAGLYLKMNSNNTMVFHIYSVNVIYSNLSCPDGKVDEFLPFNEDLIFTKTNNSFTTDKGDWLNNGSVTTTLESGRLKVSDVNNNWEGVKKELTDLNIAAGKVLDISLDFDKGTTNANVRLYVEELNADGSHSSYNVINGNLTTGSYNYKYTIKNGAGAILRVDKNNTHQDETTHFYLDNTKVSIVTNTVVARQPKATVQETLVVKTKKRTIEKKLNNNGKIERKKRMKYLHEKKKRIIKRPKENGNNNSRVKVKHKYKKKIKTKEKI